MIKNMSIYKELKLFALGKSDSYSVLLSDDDRVVNIKQVNENNLEKSIVKLEFNEEEFVSIFTNSDEDYNNSYLINAAFGHYYSGLIFIDEYYSYDEFKEGYLFHYFSRENLEIINDILIIFAPHLQFNFDEDNNRISDSDSQEIANILISIDDDACEQMAYEYAHYYDTCLVMGLKSYLKKKFCNKFAYIHFIEISCMYNYITSVGLLIDFFEDNGIDRETSSMVDALREYAIKNDLGLDEDLYEDYYSYYDDKNFDSESFNNDIKRTLEKIYDRLIEDVENETLDKNRELIDYIKKLGYSFDTIYNFPLRKNFGTETGKTFRLDKIEDGKIIAVIHGHRFKMDIEEFNNFLFHPELF